MQAWKARRLSSPLPGLEAAGGRDASRAPGHWIERGPQKRLMVFSGRSHPDLAERIAEQLGVELGEIELETFANGETYCRYDESIRGADVFLVQTGCEPVDQQPDGAAVHDPGGEARLGEADHRGHPAGSRTRARTARRSRASRSRRASSPTCSSSPAPTACSTMDLHAGQIQGFFTIPVDHMTALPLFARHFRDLGLHRRGRRLGLARRGPREDGRPLRGDDRRRLRDHAQDAARRTTSSRSPRSPAASQGKIAIVGDDVIMTGGTLLAGASALREHGATDVWVFATHGLFCAARSERFDERRPRGHRRHRHGADRPDRRSRTT